MGNGKTGFSIFQKPKKKTPYSDATTSGEVQEIWNNILARLEDKIDKKINLFYSSENQETKKKAEEDIKNLSPAEKYDLFLGRSEFPLTNYERKRTSNKYE